MKSIKPIFCAASVGLCVGLICGCATNKAKEQAATPGSNLPAGVPLRADKDIQGAWVKPGFDFKGYDTLLIEPAVFSAKQRSNEGEMREMAKKALTDQLVSSFEETGLFNNVVKREDGIKEGAKVLRLKNTITEYEKGGGGARFWAGAFGAGQPVIKVLGEWRDSDGLKCVHEVKRSGESIGSRLSGVWMSDEEIQRNDIRDMGNDLADFLRRTASLPEKQK